MDSYPDNPEHHGCAYTPVSAGDFQRTDSYRSPDIVPAEDCMPDVYDVAAMRFVAEPAAETRQKFSELLADVGEKGMPSIEHTRFMDMDLGDDADSSTYAALHCSVNGKSTPGYPLNTSCMVEASIWRIDPARTEGNLVGRVYRGGLTEGILGDDDYDDALKYLAGRLEPDEFAYLQKTVGVACMSANDPNRLYAANSLMHSAPASIPVCEVTMFTTPEVRYENGAMITYKWEETDSNFKDLMGDTTVAMRRITVRMPDGGTMHYSVDRTHKEDLFAVTFGSPKAGLLPNGMPSFTPLELPGIGDRRETGVLRPTEGSLALFNEQIATALESGVLSTGV